MRGDGHIELTPAWSLWPTAALRGAGMPFDLLTALAVPDLLDEPPGEERNSAIRRESATAAAAVVRDESVREALVWQNPNLVDTWLGDYAARIEAGDARLSNRSYREIVIARYAQRYCAKNESIGFFGPVGWARFAPGEHGVRQDGGGGIRRSTVYLETWAVAALADAWRRDDHVFPAVPVRIDAATSVRSGQIWRPHRPPVDCSAFAEMLLALIDGQRSVRQLAELAGDAGGTVDELLRLEEHGVVRIGFRVPFAERPETVLRNQVEQLADEPIRADLLRRLDDLDGARDVVERASGAADVRSALADLTRSFVKAGCAEAAMSGRTGYGRTAAYLDCRRDTDVRIGGDLLGRLRAPLGILLDSARWLAAELGDTVAAALGARYHQLKKRRDEVTLCDLRFAAADLLTQDGPAATAVCTDFQLRWAELLPDRPTGTIRLRTKDVRPLADVLFPASPPRWAAARQHSPDLMLGRDGEGNFHWVVGELHVALNTLESRVFMTQCDDPDELVRLTAADMASDRVVPLYPPEEPEATARTYPPLALDPPGRYRYWSYASDEGHQDGVGSVSGTDVLVCERDGELIGTARTHGWSAPVLEFFGQFLTSTVVNLFQPRPRHAHLHRVLLDDVVVCRESWSCPVSDVPVPPSGRTIADRGYEEVRAWAAALGMPRYVFVRTALEPKPFYVDFAAPLLVGNLVRAVRRAGAADADATVDVVEMLPRPEELWLNGDAGGKHTAEFRVVAVDERNE